MRTIWLALLAGFIVGSVIWIGVVAFRDLVEFVCRVNEERN